MSNELENLKIGDLIRVTKQERTYEGTLMPFTDFTNKDCFIIKLNNGYNIGLEITKDTKIEKISENKRTKIEKKSDFNFNSAKPRIGIISTGGTITSKVDYETGGVTSLIKANELLNENPELAEIVNINDIITPFTRMSESISFEDYSEIGKEVEEELNKGVEGIIITHGTDTLHYTSSAVSFMFNDAKKPIVLTGAQRSSDRPSSDSSMNLVCSAYVAGTSDIGETGICMHANSSDDYCHFIRGTKARKMHSSMRNAFRPINDLPIANIYPDGRIEKKNDYRKKETQEKIKAHIGFDEKTVLIKFAPNFNPEIIDFFVDRKYKGLIIEATGLGQVALKTRNEKLSWLPAVKNAVEKGLVVCFAPQTLYGRLNPNVYSEARRFSEAGVVFLDDMLPETAYIKLAWLLANEKKDDVKKKMLHNYAGEITKRTMPEEFLY